VVHCLEASLWAASRGADYREAVLLAVNLGDDTDTTAAVTGAIAGAIGGTRGIPLQWLETLVGRPMVARLAERLAARVLEESQTRHA
jgi:ADP-ribosylglycohydrolase